MAKWPTVDEILTSDIKVSHPDPYLNALQYPKFMRRKVILPWVYEKQVGQAEVLENTPFHRRTVSNSSQYQKPFTAYGRVRETVKSIFEKDAVGKNPSQYDEAFSNQHMFTSISPKLLSPKGEYRYSSCPRDYTPISTKRFTRKCQLNQNAEKTCKKVTKVDPNLQDIMKSNILSLLVKRSLAKCTECQEFKCKCLVVDNDLPKRLYENIEKGKEVTKKQKPERPINTVSKPTVTRRTGFITTSLNSPEDKPAHTYCDSKRRSSQPSSLTH